MKKSQGSPLKRKARLKPLGHQMATALENSLLHQEVEKNQSRTRLRNYITAGSFTIGSVKNSTGQKGSRFLFR
ncbi:MAG: hypothetical protein ABIK20_06845 [Candidatus Omnitrophota bacterium]